MMGAGLASEVLAACARAGVSEFCVCAGARNLSMVVGLERSSGCRVWHFFDERSAAFFALGRMMRGGGPIAVVTTSGTAVAELLPATIEAFYQSLPLVLLTADRPPRFRGSGAPQAIAQVGIFSGYARCIDIDGEASGLAEFLGRAIGRGRPAHVNVCFGEPEAGEMAAVGGVQFGNPEVPAVPAAGEQDLLEFFLEDCEGLLVMLGNLRDDERVGLLEFLQQLGAPVIAEAGSGLREKLPGLLVLEPPTGIRKVLRIGGVPSARLWRDLETMVDVRVFSVSCGMFAGLARGGETIRTADWSRMDPRPLGYSGDPSAPELAGELAWLRFLSEQIPAGALVMLGNSLPIREWNAAATLEDRGLRCYSCRGANGIDGALSTFFGLSEGEVESWAIVGDLTALYDLSAPWILPRLSAGRRRIVVINNGGGRIFSKLPALAGLTDGERRAVENDHGVSLEHWAAMWGMGYMRVGREEDWRIGDQEPAAVVEIMIPGATA